MIDESEEKSDGVQLVSLVEVKRFRGKGWSGITGDEAAILVAAIYATKRAKWIRITRHVFACGICAPQAEAETMVRDVVRNAEAL